MVVSFSHGCDKERMKKREIDRNKEFSGCYSLQSRNRNGFRIREEKQTNTILSKGILGGVECRLDMYLVMIYKTALSC